MRPDSITQSFDRALLRNRKQYEQYSKLHSMWLDQNCQMGINFHDLCHETTNRIADKVSNLVEIASITGHKDLQIL